MKKYKKCQICVEDGDEKCNAITFAQQRKILKAIDDKKYYNFFCFCCCTGVRVCEALTIKVRDIDKKNILLKLQCVIRQQKSTKELYHICLNC